MVLPEVGVVVVEALRREEAVEVVLRQKVLRQEQAVVVVLLVDQTQEATPVVLELGEVAAEALEVPPSPLLPLAMDKRPEVAVAAEEEEEAAAVLPLMQAPATNDERSSW